MKIFKYTDSDFDEKFLSLQKRVPYPKEIENSIQEIMLDVKLNGNKVLPKYAKKFDNATIDVENIKVSEQEIILANEQVDEKAKNAINNALKNVIEFSQQRIPKEWSFSPRKGVVLGERFEPLSRVGVYIPGGTAPLVSTVIHTAGIAKAAGVKNIVAVTPPNKDGSVNPAILYALNQTGVKEIYRLGGVYGIATLAYGTETVEKVEKIVGPGNSYVTAAKKLVYGDVAIDMIAGPSEIMIIADEKANPNFIAADMLSQAEHGSGYEQAVVISNSINLIEKIQRAIKEQTKKLSRKETINKVIENGMFFIEVKNINDAADLATKYAPEHLEIMTTNQDELAKNVKAAGAIFIGEWTPEPLGDFIAGPSHVLPTAGSAKYFNGLTVESFFRRMSLLNYQKDALLNELDDIKEIADMEGLDAHKNSAMIRASKH